MVVWTKAPSADAAAVELGIAPAQARARAAHLRRIGVALKRMQGGHQPRDVNVDELNELIRRTTAEMPPVMMATEKPSSEPVVTRRDLIGALMRARGGE